MSPAPMRLSAVGVDLSKRWFRSGTVVASPTAATETIIGSLTIDDDVAIQKGVAILGWAAFTVGASGTAANLRIRKDNVSGTVLSATGATTIAAAALGERGCIGFDTSPALPGQVYVVTLTVTAGAATSTVSALELHAVLL